MSDRPAFGAAWTSLVGAAGQSPATAVAGLSTHYPLTTNHCLPMLSEPSIIYAARSIEEAYALRDVLSGSGIEAVVLTELPDAGPGDGVAEGGVAARVAVEKRDADRARHIAQVFLRRVAAPPSGLPGGDAAERDLPPGWPCCPECGTPRVTRCPICHTTGTQFPAADLDFVDPKDTDLDILDPATAARSACGPACGPGGCGGGKGVGEDKRLAAAPARPEGLDEDGAASAERTSDGGAADGGGDRRLVLLCPTCDEPFAPRFARECAWCAHEFDDHGFETDSAREALEEEFDRRVILALFVLAALVLAGLAYFYYIV